MYIAGSYSKILWRIWLFRLLWWAKPSITKVVLERFQPLVPTRHLNVDLLWRSSALNQQTSCIGSYCGSKLKPAMQSSSKPSLCSWAIIVLFKFYHAYSYSSELIS